MDGGDHVNKESGSAHGGAAEILQKIEKDVNEGTFDQALYRNDIRQLKGQPEALRYLRLTLGQLKEQLPQYTQLVDAMQQQIQEMEDELESLFDTEVNRVLRFNDSVASLVDIMGQRAPGEVPSPRRARADDPESKPLERRPRRESPLQRGVLLEQMLKLVEQPWVTEADFDPLPGRMGVDGLALRIFVMTKIIELLRIMPEDMFANDDTRQAIIGAAQEHLDSLVEQEAAEEMANAMVPEQGASLVAEVMAELDPDQAGDNGSA